MYVWIVWHQITVRRRVKAAKYSRTVSNYKKGDAKGRGPEGGYLVSNGRGLGITFALHHAQPYCVELSMLDPSGQVRLQLNPILSWRLTSPFLVMS